MIIYLIIFGSFFFSLVCQVVNWYFYSCRYEDGYLHLKTGVIVKKERSIKQERVQTVNIQRGLIQRLLGLAWVLSSPKGKQFQVVDVESTEAKNVWGWYSRYH